MKNGGAQARPPLPWYYLAFMALAKERQMELRVEDLDVAIWQNLLLRCGRANALDHDPPVGP
jgi:hypothetical protein